MKQLYTVTGKWLSLSFALFLVSASVWAQTFTVSPNTGSFAGGTSVTITASSGVFSGGSFTIKFGGNLATGVGKLSPSSLTAITPAGTGTVPLSITVSVGPGAGSYNQANAFTYLACTIPGAPTANDVTSVYDGTAKTATAISSGNTLTYYNALSGGSVVSAPSATNAGTYIAYASASNACGTSPSRTLVTLSITKADATVSVNGYSGTYDGAAHGATGSATGVVGADLSGQLTLGSSFTNVPGGVANWSFAGGTNYKAQSGSVNIVLSKKDVTGTFTVNNKTYDGTNAATVTTTAVNGKVGTDDVSLSYTDATFSDANAGTGKTVTLNGTALAGAQAGNYNLSTVGTATADISKAAASLAVSNDTYVYDGTAKTVTVTTNPLGLQTVSTTGDGQTNAGVYAVTASLSNPNYDAPTVNGTLTINKAVATVSISGYSGTYDAQPHGLTGSAVGVGGASLGGLNLGGTHINAGTYNVGWTFNGGQNYTDQSGSAVVSITKADATVSVNGYSGTYDGAAHGATGSATGVGGADLSNTLNLGASFTNAPGGTANWSFNGNPNYNDQSGAASIVINQAGLTVTANNDSKPYNGVAYSGGNGVTYAGFVNGETASILGGSLTYSGNSQGAINAGSYGLTPGGLTSSNYLITYVNGALTISKANATVSVNGYSGTYDGAAHGATGSATGAAGENLTNLLNLGASYTNVPGGMANWSFSGDDNHNAASGLVAINISPKAIAVTADAKSKTYGDADPALTYNFAPALVSGDSFSGSLSRTAGEHVGDYVINQSSLTLNGNYTLAYTGANLSIGQRAIIITADAKLKVYGSTDPALTAQATNVVSSDAPTGTLDRAPGETVGTYVIGKGTYTYGSNYSETYVGADLTITQKAASVTPNAKSKVYGAADPTLDGTLLGFLPADGVTASYTRTGGESVGTYTINAMLLPVGVLGNYTITYNTANFGITPAVLTVTADARNVQYSDLISPAFTASSTGWTNGDGASLLNGCLTFTTTVQRDGNGAVLSGPGSYVVTPGGCSLSNYTISWANGSVTVTKEDSDVNYSGAEYFSTSSSTSTNALIALSATITDRNDGATTRGDVRNARIDFTGGVSGNDVVVGLVNATDKTVGTATLSNVAITLSNAEMADGGKTLLVNVQADNHYTSESVQQIVTVGVPGADFVTGGGNLVLTSTSSGQYAGTPNSEMNFGFTMKYNKSGKNLQGQITTLFRRYETVDGLTGWYTYKIKSNAINSLAVMTSGGYRKGVVSTKANLDRTNPLGVVTSLGGNLDLTLEAWEATAGNGHQIAVILRSSAGGVLFCSNWTGTTYALSTITGGNIRVLNGAGARVAAAEEPTLQVAVQISPNPTSGVLTVRVSNAGEQPSIRLRLYNTIEQVSGDWTIDLINGQGEKTIDIHSVQGGLYLLSAEGGRSRVVQRVLKVD